MAVFCLGSINADYFYKVPHLPVPGETLAADHFSFGLGGKGANQSIAAALAGAKTIHIGAVGHDGQWAIDRLAEFGVDTRHIAMLDMPTGHAIVNIDPRGENVIVIFSSANIAQDEQRIKTALSEAGPGDICILQNETNLVQFTAKLAKSKGMQVIYSAAPFDAVKASDMLPYIDMLVCNDIEFKQLTHSLDVNSTSLPVGSILVTKGSKGAELVKDGKTHHQPAFNVSAIDTTGAGDTFLGYFAARLSVGDSEKLAMENASAAAAIQVTRPGTGEAIPRLDEVIEFLGRQ